MKTGLGTQESMQTRQQRDWPNSKICQPTRAMITHAYEKSENKETEEGNTKN